MVFLARGFSKREREIINEQLLEKGKELFSTYGIRKTRIKDLTDAVGIAQGSFYNFYNSKEELFFTILEREEEKIKKRYLDGGILTGDIDSSKLKEFFLSAFKLFDNNTFLSNIYKEGEYEYLVRKLPEERINQHIAADTAILDPLIKKWQSEDKIINKSPEVISALFRGIFTLTLHKKEIGEEVYPEMIELLVELLVNGLFRGNKQ